MQSEYDIGIQWNAFPLHPETPPEGRTLKDLFAGRNVDIPQVLAHLKQVARDLELPFGDREMTYNSRLAQELGKLAEQVGKGQAYHNIVFKAYFADGLNIGLKPILEELSLSAGLSEEQIRDALENRTFEEAVDSDWSRSHKLGITAVPTFLMNGMSIVGAQSYEKLVHMMKANNVDKRH